MTVVVAALSVQMEKVDALLRYNGVKRSWAQVTIRIHRKTLLVQDMFAVAMRIVSGRERHHLIARPVHRARHVANFLIIL